MKRHVATIGVLFVMAVAFAIAVQAAPAVQVEKSPAFDSNPCLNLPRVCRYTWDPAENCCVADPRFDCYDVCF